MPTISLFEHEKSLISGWNISAAQLQKLIIFSEQHQERYFAVTRAYFIPKNYIGRVQIGDISLEILPKTDKNKALNPANGLLQLLFYTQTLPQILAKKGKGEANLGELWELYVSLLAREVSRLGKKGLLKQYEQATENQPRWANNILWSKQINTNLTRPAYFYAARWELNPQHLYNQIIAQAVAVAIRQRWSEPVMRELRQAQAELNGIKITNEISEIAFNQLVFSRQNVDYRLALQLARFVLFNLNPQSLGGADFALSFWVSMPVLYEKYIKIQLATACIKANWRFAYQQPLAFWKQQPQRPDFWVENTQKSYILDAKWKTPYRNQANGEDLRQMFSYGILAEASELLLIYPQTTAKGENSEDFFYKKTKTSTGEKNMRLRLIFIELWDKKGGLNLANGELLIQEMKKN